MSGHNNIHYINKLRHRWILCQLLYDVLLCAAVGLVVVAFLNYFVQPVAWGICATILTLIILFFAKQPWRVNNRVIIAFLNKTYPQLEESAGLLICNSHQLTLLQQWQQDKVAAAITMVPAWPAYILQSVRRALLLLLLSICVYAGFALMSRQRSLNPTIINKYAHAPKAEKILPQIEGLTISITPPPYTGKPQRTQDKFTILAEEGAYVHWRISTNTPVRHMLLILNDSTKVQLRTESNGTIWTTGLSLNKTGFYQLSIDGKLSDLYQIGMIKDQPPVLHIKWPRQYTYIDAGEAPRVLLNATAEDDYGIASAMLHATVAKGSGEGVKFKEYPMSFDIHFDKHYRQYNLQKTLDLPALKMEPGDELYFYIEARDTHGQSTRTDAYTVTLQDTAQLLSMNGMLTGVNQKPEFFRSERQIILDTEKLLKDKDSLSREKFNSISNDLATDQKLLRLRYGKFLGEEEESDIGGPGNNSDLAKIENFNNAAMILDAYTDKHDNAEDATYFEPAIKTQLKATLTEMWKAELQLRMYKPHEALPFEYKALRLLKDLQQKSRLYVAKTAYNPPPLKPEKRLTGELDKIISPENQKSAGLPDDEYATFKSSIQVLEYLKQGGQLTPAMKHSLQLTRAQLGQKAAAEPGIYLKAVAALNSILSGNVPHTIDVATTERAIQRALPSARQLPQQSVSKTDMGLSDLYYQNLKRGNR